MTFVLSEKTITAGYRLKEFEHIGSTNAEALANAQTGEAGSVWYVTKDQRSGRGRRGREWSTQTGNLAATLLLVHDYPLELAATLSFVAGLSLVEAVEQLLPDTPTRFQLKWPNDVLADGAKLSGILLESSLLKDERKALVIGIGVNVLHSPEGVPYAVSNLKANGYSQGAEQLLEALAERFAVNFALWNDGQGLETIRTHWLRHAARLGEIIRVQSGGEMLEGTFSSIDSQGHLVLSLPQGRKKTISAGEVFFGAETR
ncbi:biotin--[acetyl-CoA-carboxylase] ligase [Pseudochrobactrum kiredjianiae]|uniref:biotin--[biotin carboxyl-carrier protein] ligase n=1 Tax=Pseudochrobactrum kiredjianiae TaxID=386305 RepID=A0ABW3VB30_9HYPH|nr:biotin--[acetyl-CoA-carboxylase] ligase [Pseudochrobactrum kiredjianiae]MDM7851465.1 biotin--[acetyl-CoA-carboxylase] ligase [Pseudochrobactrum kiredjianiae]